LQPSQSLRPLLAVKVSVQKSRRLNEAVTLERMQRRNHRTHRGILDDLDNIRIAVLAFDDDLDRPDLAD